MLSEVGLLVGQRIRRRRRLMDMTQQDLAAMCGVSFQQIQKYECAYSRLSVEMLWRLACALEVDVGYFFTGLSRELDGDDASGDDATAADTPGLRARRADAA